ncbi:MAG: GNAT family N-acetyltransferase [Ferruginibacter sp.]
MIHLVPFKRIHFEELIHWVNSEELLVNWSGSLFSYPLTLDSLNWYIDNTNVKDESDAFVYRVEDAQGNGVGHISLGGLSWKNRSARISRVLIGNTEKKGKGHCKQMIKAVLKIGFEELQLHRIELGVYSNNVSAIRCYENAGMKIEGLQRDVLWQNNQWWSRYEMSILDTEWFALHP